MRHAFPLIFTLLLGACATARMDAQWRDPQAGTPMPPGSRILVRCEAAEQTVQRICQDQFAAQLRRMGADPLLTEVGSDSALSAAHKAGAQWLIVSNIRQNNLVVADRRPSVGFGVGGGSGHIGTGVGITLPFPGSSSASTPTLNYGSDTALTHVPSGKLYWSGKASTWLDDIAAQMQALSQITLEAARKDGAL